MDKTNALHYLRFGSGPRYLIAIHGFADRAELYMKLGPALEDRFTVIAVDLPFHGKTKWDKSTFNPEEIRKGILEILEKESIDAAFSVMGHSMGGRIILSLSEFFGDRIDSYIMLAPAGFQGTLSDSKLLFPKFLRKFLKLMTAWPAFILFIFKIGKFLGIINQGTYNFLEKQIAIEERRNRLFDCWVSLYDFPHKPDLFKKIILEKKAKLNFFYGKRDYITPAKYANKFIKNIEAAQLYLVDDGHYFLKEPLAEALKNAEI
jgi:pimeloyl-ACP methyl ester carboxylesterase